MGSVAGRQSTLLFAAVVIGLGGGCRGKRVYVRELPHQNPTHYVFDATVPDVRKAVGKAFESPGFGDPDNCTYANAKRLWLIERPSDSFPWRLLKRPGNENDVVLHNGHDPFRKSAVYYNRDGPCDYAAIFHIHLAAVAPQRTKVEIFTHRPQVISGKGQYHIIHGAWANYIVDVAPTTIEEYEILLAIGKQLRQQAMPPLVQPDPAKEGLRWRGTR